MTPLLLVLLAAPAAGPAAPSRPKSGLPDRAAVFVLADDAAKAQAGRVQSWLLRALKEADVPLSDLDAAFPPAPAENVGALRFKEGTEAYDNLDLEGADQKFKEALAFFIDYPELATPERLAETHTFIGAIALQRGGKQAAKKCQEELARAVVVNPGLELDPKFFGPDVKKALEKARAEVGKRDKAAIAVQSTPEGAEVRVHGLEPGLTPVPDVKDLPFGRHLVTFKLAGHAPVGLLVDLGLSGGEAKATLVPTEAFAAALVDAKGLATPDALAAKVVPGSATALATKAGARFLLLVTVEAGEAAPTARLQAWDVDSGGKLSDVTLGAPGSYGAAAQAVKRFLEEPSPVSVPVAVEEPGPSDSVLKKWWFWAAVGGAVVAGTTTAVVASSQPRGRPFNVVLNVP